MVELAGKALLQSIINEENAKSETPEFEIAPEPSEVAPEAPKTYGPPVATPLQRRMQDIINEENTKVDQGTAIALEAAKVQNPTLYRKAQKEAQLGDLPPDVIYRNIEKFEEREKLDRAREVLNRNPTLHDWFQHADNAKTVEAENLEAIDGVSWVLKAGSRAAAQGTGQLEVADIRWNQMFGLASPEDIRRADEMEATFTDDFGGAGWVGRGFTGALSNLPIMGSVVGGGIRGAAVGTVVGAGAGSIIPGIGTVAGAGTGATVGGAVGTFHQSMKINSALAFSEYIKIRGEGGGRIDRDTAAGAAIIAGSLMAGLDTASLGILLKATGIGSLIARVGPQAAIKEALKDKTFFAIAKNVGKRFAGAIGAEVVTEGVQEAVAIATGEVTKIIQAESEAPERKRYDPQTSPFGQYKPITYGDALSRIGEAGRDAALATAFLGLVPMGGRLAIDYSAARQQVTETARASQLVELARKDKLVKEDPAKASEVLAASLQGSDKDTVYIDTASIKQFMQEEDSPELAALSRVPEFQRRLSEAVQTGSDVAIPTADFYAYVAASDAAANIVDKLKFSPDGMSKKEAEAFVKALEKIRDKEVPLGEEPKTSVGADIYEKTRKAGATPDQARAYAALYGSFFDSMAAQTGRTAYDIYSAYNLDLTQVDANPDPSALNTFDQAKSAIDKLKPSRIRAAIRNFANTDMTNAVTANALAMVRETGSARAALESYNIPKDQEFIYRLALEAIQSALSPVDAPLDQQFRDVQNLNADLNMRAKRVEEIRREYTDLIQMFNDPRGLGISPDVDSYLFSPGVDSERARAKFLASHLEDDFKFITYGKQLLFETFPAWETFMAQNAAVLGELRTEMSQALASTSQHSLGNLVHSLSKDYTTRYAKSADLAKPTRKDGKPTTFAQNLGNYDGLDRVPSWKKIPNFATGSKSGTEFSIVIAPDGGIYNLDTIHAQWASGSPDPSEAVRMTAYWSERNQTFSWSARFNAGKLTERQAAQLKQAAAFAGIKPNELIVTPFKSPTDLSSKDPGEPIFSVQKRLTDAPNPTLDEFVKEHPLASSFGQPQAQGKGKVLRGAITFAPDKTTIRLFRNANLSTLLHETGHLFLQVMADLEQGKRTYGGQLFQDSDVKKGDWVNLYDTDGNVVGEPRKISAIVDIGGKPHFTIEGGKAIYPIERAVIISKGEKIEPPTSVEEEIVQPELEQQQAVEEGTEEPGAPALLVGESPVEDPAALGTASSPEDISPEDSSYYSSKFELLIGSNAGLRKFVEGKPQATPLEKRDLLFAYFPRSKEAVAHARSIAARAENNDPVLVQKLLNAGVMPKGGKINPLGVQTEEVAALNIDDTITHVGSIIKAAAKLTEQVSARQTKKALTALRLSLRKIRKGAAAEEINADAWAQLEADMQLIQPGQKFSDEVKKVVNEYIELYKKDAAQRDSQKANKAKREGEQAAKQVEATRAEDLSSAIAELSTVIERVEKIEAQKEARQSLIDDMNTLRAWLGEDGPEFSVKAHEQFAVAFEAYLFEGVAPNEGLRRAFDRFKTWLKLVYRKITNIGVRPTPEVRAVFDRMLTIDQTIQNEMASPAFQPSFNTAEEMGVSQEEFDDYMGRVRALAEVGREAAEKVAVGEASKQRTKAVQAAKKKLRADHTADLSGQRVYRVIKYLQGKKLGDLKPVKLDRARVEAIMGKGKLNTIPNGNSMWTTKEKGGVEPSVVATMFGYNTAAEMLADIQSVEPLKVAVEERVAKDIAEMTDEQLVTPPEVAEMAAAKLRSGVYQDFLRQEIRTFSKLMGNDFTEAHATQFKRMAAEIIEDKTVRNVARRNFLREYYEADRKIGKLLDTAIKKKQWDEVLDLRRKQLFNSYLIQNAYDAKSKQTDAIKYMKGFTKAKANKIDQGYLTQIRNLVIGLNLIRGQQDPNAPAFSRFLDQELDSGNMIVLDPRIKKNQQKIYLHLSHGELMAMHGAIKNLDFVGRNKRSIFKEGKVLDLNMAVQQIADAMDNNLIPAKPLPTLNRRGLSRLAGAWQSYTAMHTKIEQLCDWIDGRAPQGPAHKYIFQPLADAQARAYEMSKQYGEKLLTIINKKPSSYWSEEYLISEVGIKVKRSEMLAVALNMGNESNLSKLKKGMGWTDQQLAAVTSRLDKADWEIAQEIWDTLQGLWPLIQDVGARIGIPRADKIEPISFTNEHGTFRGGYYPVVYDPSKSADALARGLTTKAEQQFGFQPHSMFPSKGFANDRDNEYARPMHLDMTVLSNHVSKVVHYITHAEAAYNVQKIMGHSKFKDRLLAQFGQGMFESMKGWIELITQGETEISGLGAASRFLRHLRQNISLAALGFRVMTVVAQAGGVFAGAEMIGLRGVARGLKEMYGSASIERISENFNFVREKSAEMRNRTQFLDRDLTDMSEAFQSKGRFRQLKDMAMKPMMLADQVVATAVWMGAYSRQISRTPHDEQLAINYADKVVRLTQGAAGHKDLAAFQRGGEFAKLFTMFYTYFSAMQNRLIDIGRTAKYRFSEDAPQIQALDTPNEVLRYMYLIVLPSLTFDFLMKGALQGDFTEEDSDKDLLASALWKVASYSLAGFVGIRDMASFVGKDGFEWRYGGPPMVRNIDMTIERMNRMIGAAKSEDRDVKGSDVLRTAVDVTGYVSGLPVDAPTLIFQNYLKAQEKGEEIGLADFFVRR